MSIYQEKALGLSSIDKDSPFFIHPLFPYVVLKKIINLSHDGLFNEFEYHLGKESAKLLCETQIKAGMIGTRGIKAAFEELENMGFGITKIIILQQNKIIIKNLTTPIARQYAKSFFEDKIKVDSYLAGFYSGVLSSYFKKNIDIEEKKCKVEGSEDCVFTRTDEVQNKYALNMYIQKALEHQRIYSEKEIKYPHKFCVEMLHRGIYYKKEGIVKLANIYHVFFRFGFFAFSEHILSKLAKDISDLYKYVGYMMSSTAINFQKNQFGRKNPDTIFDEVVTHLNMGGYGNVSILSRTDNEIIIQFNDSLLLRQSLQFMKKFEDSFLKGALMGHATVYSKPVSIMEFSNFGNDKLIAKIVLGQETNLIDELDKNITSPKIKYFARERMKHKYYLSP